MKTLIATLLIAAPLMVVNHAAVAATPTKSTAKMAAPAKKSAAKKAKETSYGNINQDEVERVAADSLREFRGRLPAAPSARWESRDRSGSGRLRRPRLLHAVEDRLRAVRERRHAHRVLEHQLAARRIGAFAQLLDGCRLDGQRGVEAVADGQQAFGKAFYAELARLGDFVFSAAAGIFRFGLGTQKLVGQLGALGLDLRELGLQTGDFVRAVGSHGGFHFFRRGIRRDSVGCGILFRHGLRLQE